MSDININSAINDIKISLLDTISTSFQRIIQNSLVVPCKIGCSACCKRYIQISVAEAIIMVEHLKNTNSLSDVMKKASEQSEMAMECNPIAWYKMQIPCPLLKNDTCLAYCVRPVTCCTHFVISSPEACNSFSTHSIPYIPYDLYGIYTKFIEILESRFKEHSILRHQLPMAVALKLANKFAENSYTNLNDIISLYNTEMNAL